MLGGPRQFDSQAQVTRMESGRLRIRPLQPLQSELRQATWNFVGDQFAAFHEFFRDDLANGSISFLMPTSRTDEEETLEEFAFWEGQFQLNRQDNLFVVTAVIEIVETGVVKTVDLCAVEDPTGTYDVSGDTFDCYVDGYSGPFAAGSGFAGAWRVAGIEGIALDSFEPYSDGDQSGLNRGVGFAESSVLTDVDYCSDTFESYTAGSSPDSGGEGFDSSWTITEAI